MKLLKHIILPIPGSAFLRTRFTSIHREESGILRELPQSNVRCVKTIIEPSQRDVKLSLACEIFHKTNLYDLCFEILLTTKLLVDEFVEGTLYNHACADAFVLTRR